MSFKSRLKAFKELRIIWLIHLCSNEWMNEWMYLIELNKTGNDNESNVVYHVENTNKKYHWETEKRNERTGTKDLFSTKRNERTNNMGWNRNLPASGGGSKSIFKRYQLT